MADLSKIRALDCELSVRTSNLIRRWYNENVTLWQLDRPDDELAAPPLSLSRKAIKEIREVIENYRAMPEHSLEEQMSIDAVLGQRLRHFMADCGFPITEATTPASAWTAFEAMWRENSDGA